MKVQAGCGHALSEVEVKGTVEEISLDGTWEVEALEALPAQFADVTAWQSSSPMRLMTYGEEVRLSLRRQSVKVMGPDEIAERNLVYGLLREEDEDARQAIAALHRLDRMLPDDKEALIEVSAEDGKPKFEVRVRDRG